MTYREADDLQFYKFGHSITFDYAGPGVRETVRPRSPAVPRGPSFPALVPDISKDIITESRRRRSIHESALKRDRSAFFK